MRHALRMLLLPALWVLPGHCQRGQDDRGACAPGGPLALIAACAAQQDGPTAPPEDTGDLDEGDDPLPAPRAIPAPPADVPGAARLYAEALRELAALRHTRYAHHAFIDEATGTFEYDCSGFVDYALSIVAPDALARLRPLQTRRRPQAKTYVALLGPLPPGAASGPWLRLGRIAQLGAGDVIAWLRSPLQKNRNTGHVMIVAGNPAQRSAQEWVVPIIDASGGGHGGGDLRHKPDSTGLGRGTIVLVAEAGVPRAFRWSERSRSPAYDTTIVLGRLR